ncbi:MAG: hypothetical protein HY360_18855 [Verrucomicrobia bacterium]|nr:hypothetical protein [Verrucomicrobiota bacterium]
MKVKVEKGVLLLGEPLVIHYSIKNIGSVEQRFENYEDMRPILVSEDGETFKEIVRPRRPDPQPVAKLVSSSVLPNQSQTYSEVLLLDLSRVIRIGGSGAWLIFPRAGKFYVKVRYADPNDPAEDISTIRIEEPKGMDAEAWNIYRDEGVFRYVQYDGFIGRVEYSNKKRYDQFYMGGKDSKDILARVEKIIKEFPDTTYGRILQNVRTKGQNPIVGQPAEPKDASAYLNEATKELEAQWYDVKGFPKEHPEENEQYLDQVQQWFDERGEEKISEDEFGRRSAELLKTCVKKHSKPLSQEEWKRRYAQYDAEAKANQAKKKGKEEEWRRKYGAIKEIEQTAFAVSKTTADFYRLYQEGLEKLLKEAKDDDLKRKIQETLADLPKQRKQQEEFDEQQRQRREAFEKQHK